MSVEQKILTLCDRWWTELSHSESGTMKPVAQEWMGYLGWAVEEALYLEGAACAFNVDSASGQRIIFYFTMPGALETPSVMIEKGLDYCECTLALLGESQLEGYDYAVMGDLNRSYVYDVRSGELLLHSDSPNLFVRDVMPELLKSSVDDQGLDEVRRDPGSAVARQLRVWSQRWATILSREPNGSEGVADAIMDRVLVLRFLYDHSICESPSWSYRMHFTQLITTAYDESPARARRALLRLMDDLHRIWQSDMFVPDDSVRRIITRSIVVVEMIQELALMSKNKFTQATILESFNFGEAAEKARVRLVPEYSEERELWLARLSETQLGDSKIELDIMEEGYRSIPHWFDRLLNALMRVGREHDLTEVASECTVAAPDFEENGELDLFSWREEEPNYAQTESSSEVDLIKVCLQRLFVVWAVGERQQRTARMMLLLHLIELYASDRYAFGVFPGIEQVITERPTLQGSEKPWLHEGEGLRAQTWDAV